MKRIFNRNRGFCLLFFFLLVASLTNAQHGLWNDVDESFIHVAPADRRIIPNQYRTLQLDFGQMKNMLATAPAEAEVIAGEPGLELSLPMPDGGMARFLVWNSPVMHPDLAAQFPGIQSFAGKGVDFPTAYVRFDISPQGFHAMALRTGKGTVFIDPYAKGDVEHYIVYFRKTLPSKTAAARSCVLSMKIRGYHCLPKCRPVNAPAIAATCESTASPSRARASTPIFQGSFGADKGPALAAMNNFDEPRKRRL